MSASNQSSCPTNRRLFLQRGMSAAIAASILGACSKATPAAQARKPDAQSPVNDSDHSGGSMAPHPAVAPTAATTACCSDGECRCDGRDGAFVS